MKKSVKLLALAFVMLLFSGCMKARTDITVNSNGSIDYTYTVAMSTKVQESMKGYGNSSDDSTGTSSNATLTEEQKEEAKKHGFDIQVYDKDGFKGYTITKHFNSIDEVSSEDEVVSTTALSQVDNIKLFTVKKGFLKNTYVAKVTFDSEKESNESTKQYDQEQYKEYFEGLDISYNITLPTTAKSSNATNVDGKKLSWDLTKFDKERIEFEFEVLNTNNLIMLIGGICVVVAIVIGVVVLVIKKKKATK